MTTTDDRQYLLNIFCMSTETDRLSTGMVGRDTLRGIHSGEDKTFGLTVIALSDDFSREPCKQRSCKAFDLSVSLRGWLLLSPFEVTSGPRSNVI